MWAEGFTMSLSCWVRIFQYIELVGGDDFWKGDYLLKMLAVLSESHDGVQFRYVYVGELSLKL